MKLRKKFTLKSGNSPLRGGFDYGGKNDYSKAISVTSSNPSSEENKPVKGSEVTEAEDTLVKTNENKNIKKSAKKFDYSKKKEKIDVGENLPYGGKGDIHRTKESYERATSGDWQPKGLHGKELTGINAKIVKGIVSITTPDNALEALSYIGGAGVIKKLKSIGSRLYQGAKFTKKAVKAGSA